ncbi:transporter substrate-binding domain-containing protein [Streptomyces sp. NPDC058751]|uniref:transporter substrate-binding domain-containing protein n=1 Tax=Streptomyces sp. NPDC058751 TaxID=3346623 RepID=UPI0036ABC4C7
MSGETNGPRPAAVEVHDVHKWYGAQQVLRGVRLTVRPGEVTVGALPSGSAPLNFVGEDQKALTGSEPDLGRLVAAVLGPKPVVRNSTWENLFVGVDSGKVDAAFSPNPAVAYPVTQNAKSPHPTRNAGRFSGAGATLQGLIAATAKKDSGLAKPVAAAVNHLIESGQYAEWPAAWNLSDEAVGTSRVDPPGLPLDNS